MLGLGGSVVVDFCMKLPVGPNYKLYFDNFFTSFNLLVHLREMGIGATGTVLVKVVQKNNSGKSTRGQWDV